MSLFSKEQATTFALITGKHLECVVCGCDKFYSREAQLHSSAATFFGLEWTGESAHCAVCGQCGYIHWFLPMK